MSYNSIEEVGQFLGKLPTEVDSDTLFDHIASVTVTKSFDSLLQQENAR